MTFDRCFMVPIEPQAYRERTGRTTSGVTYSYRPEKQRAFQKQLAQYAMLYRPSEKLDVPLRVDILAVRSRPQALMRNKDPDGLIWPRVKRNRDADNIRKAVLDSLRDFWIDDGLIVAGDTLVAVAEKEGAPRLVIHVLELTTSVAAEAIRIGLIAPTPLDEQIERAKQVRTAFDRTFRDDTEEG